MKLRRALTAVAATAVIAPAALLAAPAAYATGPGAETATTAPTPQAPGPDGNGGTTSAPDAPPAAGEPTPAGDTGAASGSTTGGAGPTAPSTASPSATPGPSVAPTPPGGTTAPGSPSATAPSDGEDDCTIDDASLKTEVRNLPSKLVAGAGWSRFTVALTNTTDRKLDEVYPFILAVPLEPLDGGDHRAESTLHLEYLDPDTGKWTAFGEWTDGDYFGWFELDPHETAELTMRISADKSAKSGDGFALVAGDYYNADGSCGSSAEQWYDFAILAAGSKPGQVPPAKPGKPGNKPGPQGGAKPVTPAKPKEDLAKLPVTGNLAETGASSALPTIAMIGGVAMVVGAGAIFAVRRRKATGGAAA
ncbi:LPXTG cell wall anchor domain-containing protein [Streptomyces sp. RS10V-4]|uniref:LAETG motif-containing sortase-dependent surface protein n=1 Tax=Streptomyces rhizoryzae TaxID=2932493 RepID=UPI002004DD71|nr:LAETG motif-containing sortase-dependent surface protein [Streptomyces rhizoryzae]MCK7622912.1 LPXTG cell wall anchor domain-containing protein [Streptomyces rhizoryzae]